MNDYNVGEMYQQMELHLIQSMKRNLKRHLKEEQKYGFDWTQWQAEKLKEIKRYQNENSIVIGRYQNQITDEVKKQLKQQFMEGNKNSQYNFKKAIESGYKSNSNVKKSFFKINDRKVNNLVNSVNNDLKIANASTLRLVNDQYREIIHRATMFASNGVLTEKQAIDMATKDFLSKGLNSIEYSNGNRVNVASYAKMAVSTANQRAYMQGEGEFRKKIGNPLIKISKHGTSCELCQPWEGKVLIDDVYSGGTKKNGSYDLLSVAMKQGLYHPNCKHGLGTYYPELEDIEFDDHGPSEETINNYQDDINYCNLQIQKYKRLELGSLDKNNILEYRSKKQQWENKKENILTYDEQYAINTYIGPESYIINENLRSGIELSDRQSTIVKNLDKALDKMPSYNGNVIRSVWIESNDVERFMKNYKVGSITSFDEYLSTTNGDIYNPKARVQLYIRSNSGKDITKYNKKEKEILFKRKSNFLVLDIDKKEDYFINIYMEEI